MLPVGDADCDVGAISDADFDLLSESISDAASSAVELASLASCGATNEIVANLLYKGVCVSLQSGAVSTWVGTGIQGLTTFLAMFFFRRVMKTQAKGKVAPTDGRGSDEMAAFKSSALVGPRQPSLPPI